MSDDARWFFPGGMLTDAKTPQPSTNFNLEGDPRAFAYDTSAMFRDVGRAVSTPPSASLSQSYSYPVGPMSVDAQMRGNAGPTLMGGFSKKFEPTLGVSTEVGPFNVRGFVGGQAKQYGQPGQPAFSSAQPIYGASIGNDLGSIRYSSEDGGVVSGGYGMPLAGGTLSVEGSAVPRYKNYELIGRWSKSF